MSWPWTDLDALAWESQYIWYHGVIVNDFLRRFRHWHDKVRWNGCVRCYGLVFGTSRLLVGWDTEAYGTIVYVCHICFLFRLPEKIVSIEKSTAEMYGWVLARLSSVRYWISDHDEDYACCMSCIQPWGAPSPWDMIWNISSINRSWSHVVKPLFNPILPSMMFPVSLTRCMTLFTRE